MSGMLGFDVAQPPNMAVAARTAVRLAVFNFSLLAVAEIDRANGFIVAQQ